MQALLFAYSQTRDSNVSRRVLQLDKQQWAKSHKRDNQSKALKKLTAAMQSHAELVCTAQELVQAGLPLTTEEASAFLQNFPIKFIFE